MMHLDIVYKLINYIDTSTRKVIITSSWDLPVLSLHVFPVSVGVSSHSTKTCTSGKLGTLLRQELDMNIK